MTANTPDVESQAEQLLPDMASTVIEALNLEVKPGDIDPDSPLYGGELALDSIDILEIALVVSKKYKIVLKANDEDNAKIFASLRTLARYVVEKRSVT
jgi:acyl carrier protein